MEGWLGEMGFGGWVCMEQADAMRCSFFKLGVLLVWLVLFLFFVVWVVVVSSRAISVSVPVQKGGGPDLVERVRKGKDI